MDNFDLKKYLAEGRLFKEEQMGSYGKFLKVVKSYEDEEILSDFLDSYPKGQDISKSEYDKFTEKHFGLADPEDHRGKNWKYIMSEGRLLKEELTPLQQYVYNFEKEVSGEDNAKEFLDGIKKLNTPKDVYDYYAFERNWEGDSDLEGDLENIYNQVLDKFKSKN
jgi:hypothetical protein